MINSVTVCTQVSQFNSNVVFFNAQGIAGLAAAGGVSNIDLKLVDDHFLTGGHLRLKGQFFGDSINIQVVDKDNVMGYGAGVVLRQFVTNWSVSDDSSMQADFDLTYPAKVIAGLYLRIVYNSTGLTAVKVLFNWSLHKVMI